MPYQDNFPRTLFKTAAVLIAAAVLILLAVDASAQTNFGAIPRSYPSYHPTDPLGFAALRNATADVAVVKSDITALRVADSNLTAVINATPAAHDHGYTAITNSPWITADAGTNISLSIVAPYTNAITTAWQNPPDSTNWTWTSDGKEITLTGYNFASLDVIIPDILDGLPVTKMDNIFSVPPSYAGSEITSISGGEKISTIKYASFSGCLSLTNVALYGVQHLEDFSFAGCEALKTVFVKNVLSVGDYSFDTCTALTIFKISTDAPEEKTLVFWHIPTNQVTITVDNPTATGWSSTWNGMPVIRLPVKAQGLNAGTVISITSNTEGTNSAGFFSGNGGGLTNLPSSGISADAVTNIARSVELWNVHSNMTGSVTITNQFEAPVSLSGTGAVSIAFSGLRDPYPVYVTAQGFSSLVFPANTYLVGGGSWQTNRINHFIVWQYSTNLYVNPVITTEL